MVAKGSLVLVCVRVGVRESNRVCKCGCKCSYVGVKVRNGGVSVASMKFQEVGLAEGTGRVW